MEFNKDTKIGEILEKAPEKAEILLEIGMHCLGCPASQMETLEEACAVHGIDVEEVIEKYGKTVEMKPINKEKFYIKLKVNPLGFRLWAMKNLDLVTVKKPKSLVNEIKNIIEEASNRYN